VRRDASTQKALIGIYAGRMEDGKMSTLAIAIFVLLALFTCWFVPWYHRRDPDAVIRYVPRIAASAAFLGILALIVRLAHAYFMH
jgi:hypothetical protein